MGVIINQLKQILSCPYYCGTAHSIVNIEEENNTNEAGEYRLRKIKLTDISANMLIIHPDKATKVRIANRNVNCISPLNKIDGTVQHNRACDAVLIEEFANLTCRLVFIELKSRDVSGASTQLKSTVCFFDYIQSVLKLFYDIEAGFDEKRFIVLHTATQRSIRKRPTGPVTTSKANRDSSNPAKRVVVDNQRVSASGLI